MNSKLKGHSNMIYLKVDLNRQNFGNVLLLKMLHDRVILNRNKFPMTFCV